MFQQKVICYHCEKIALPIQTAKYKNITCLFVCCSKCNQWSAKMSFLIGTICVENDDGVCYHEFSKRLLY